MYLNKVQLIGRVGKNPSITAIVGGGQVASFSIATNEVSNGETYTKWHRIVAWNAMVKAAQHLTTGRLVYVEGRLDYNEYNGTVYARIVAEKIRYLDASKGQSQSGMGSGVNGPPLTQKSLF